MHTYVMKQTTNNDIFPVSHNYKLRFRYNVQRVIKDIKLMDLIKSIR